KTRFEDALERACVACGGGTVIQCRELRAAPELLLEILGLALGALQLKALEKDVVPGEERREEERRHDQLHEHARVGHEAYDRQVLRNGRIQIRVLILVASGCGIRVGRIVRNATQTTLIAAVARSSSP